MIIGIITNTILENHFVIVHILNLTGNQNAFLLLVKDHYKIF